MPSDISDDIFDTTNEGAEIEINDNLVKLGDDIDLTIKDPVLNNITIGIGWDLNEYSGETIDVDVSLFLLNKDGKTRVDEDFIFYNNSEACEGAIKHMGDSRTGAGAGDDETIQISLHGIPYDVLQLAFVISIYQASEKGQDLSRVEGAFIRIVEAQNNHELVRYEFSGDLEGATENAILVALLDREGPKWHFRPQNKRYQGGLAEVAKSYDIVVAGDQNN